MKKNTITMLAILDNY